jgi:transposase
LTRTQRQLIRERSRHAQRIHKVLEDANIKITAFITDILGHSGRRILDAIVDGTTDPEQLATIGARRLKSSQQQRRAALQGAVTEHHRFLLRMHLRQVDDLDAIIEEVQQRIDQQLQPMRQQHELLTGMPGIGPRMAQVLIAEIGIDMSRFPSSAHVVSWAGLCPRNDESAGKRRSTRVRRGAPWLKPALVQSAWGAVRKKDGYFRAMYYRIRARRGSKKAIVAVAAALLSTAYHILATGTPYADLGHDHYEQLDRERTRKRLVRRLQGLGYNVELSAA